MILSFRCVNYRKPRRGLSIQWTGAVLRSQPFLTSLPLFFRSVSPRPHSGTHPTTGCYPTTAGPSSRSSSSQSPPPAPIEPLPVPVGVGIADHFARPMLEPLPQRVHDERRGFANRKAAQLQEGEILGRTLSARARLFCRVLSRKPSPIASRACARIVQEMGVFPEEIATKKGGREAAFLPEMRAKRHDPRPRE